MSPETPEQPHELTHRQRMASLLLGGLCLGAGINCMVGNDDFMVDAAGVLLATAGSIGIILGLVRPGDNDPGQQR